MVRRATQRRIQGSPRDLRRESLMAGVMQNSYNEQRSAYANPRMIKTMKIISSKPRKSIDVPRTTSRDENEKKLEAKNISVDDSVVGSWWKDLYQGGWVTELFDTEGKTDAALEHYYREKALRKQNSLRRSVEGEPQEVESQEEEQQAEDLPLIDGYNVVTYPNGDVYAGNWQDGKRHGIGKLTFGRGVGYYDGEWKDGLYDGLGTLCWTPSQMLPIHTKTAFSAAQRRYEGEFKNGLFHGLGREYGTDGVLRKEGMWENGSLRHRVVIHVLPQPSFTIGRVGDGFSLENVEDYCNDEDEEDEDEEEAKEEQEELQDDDFDEFLDGLEDEEEKNEQDFDKERLRLILRQASRDVKQYRNTIHSEEKTADEQYYVEDPRTAKPVDQVAATEASDNTFLDALLPQCFGMQHSSAMSTHVGKPAPIAGRSISEPMYGMNAGY